MGNVPDFEEEDLENWLNLLTIFSVGFCLLSEQILLARLFTLVFKQYTFHAMETPDVWKEFSGNVITHSGAHHLLAILELSNERGYARVTDIARSLDITTGSASTNLKSLKQKGYVVEDENKFLSLSGEGQSLAEAIISRRNILIEFYTSVLGVSAEQAEIDACKTEHLLSGETTSKMSDFLKKKGS